MKTVRRLLYREIVGSVLFVTAAFLSLFFFIDFVDELNDRSASGRGAWRAAHLSALEIPGHLYELIPISVLIGTIYALSRMAQSSEFTILRTGGLGPGRALGLLASLGLAFAAVTFVVGDHAAPWAERQVALNKARASGITLGQAGAWLKERRQAEDGSEISVSINVGAARGAGDLQGVHIFEHDAQGRLLLRLIAQEAHVDGDAVWHLREVQRTRWPVPQTGPQRLIEERLPELAWRSTLTADVVGSAVLPLKTMTTLDLWRYSTHLNRQAQDAQRYAIQFWKKALYPLACVVMVALALPFAYLHARAGGVSLKVFGGIMLGISFVLLNNVAGHLGVLRGWTPWVAAATPALTYLFMSLVAFAWLVRYR
ncbi:MAG: LPS export ABC transporter permease LptG [Rubrivivax sp.]|nr:LPS export ABC transporter permease LptG [Rubrivivax sp.]